MKIVLIVIIILLLLIALLLLLPIHYDLKLKKDGEMEIEADLKYPFDMIKFHLDYFLLLNCNLKLFGIKVFNKTIDMSANKDKDKKQKKKNTKDNKDGKKKKGLVQNVLSLSIKEKLALLSNLKKDIPIALKQIKPKYDKISVDLGLDNPFLLGALLGLLSTIKLILKDLKIYPHWTEKVFKIDMELRSDIRLITLLIIALKFRFSKKYRELF